MDVDLPVTVLISQIRKWGGGTEKMIQNPASIANEPITIYELDQDINLGQPSQSCDMDEPVSV